MNNNLRMSGAMFLMLKKSSDRRQREALEAAFKVIFISGQYTSFLVQTAKVFKRGLGFQLTHLLGFAYTTRVCDKALQRKVRFAANIASRHTVFSEMEFSLQDSKTQLG